MPSHHCTLSATKEVAFPKCKPELIQFSPLENLANFLQHLKMPGNSVSWCTSPLHLACTEAEPEGIGKETEGDLPSRWQLTVTWMGTGAIEGK